MDLTDPLRTARALVSARLWGEEDRVSALVAHVGEVPRASSISRHVSVRYADGPTRPWQEQLL
jgi:hypothetical protein